MNNKFEEFLDWYHNCVPSLDSETILAQEDISKYLVDCDKSANRQFISDKKRTYVGASGLGKPLILLALQKLQYPYVFYPPNVKTHLIFHLGDLFEALVTRLLASRGIEITRDQEEIHIPGTDVYGHIDGFYEPENALIEVKTMSGSYFKSFVKKPNDFRGYMTQLGVYKKHTGAEKAYWICFNKETSEIAIVEPDYEELDRVYQIAYEKAVELAAINTPEDIATLPVPEPKAEVFKKEPTGKLLVPPSMQFTPYRSAWYEMETGKNGYNKKTIYVNNIITDSHRVVDELQNIKQEMELY